MKKYINKSNGIYLLAILLVLFVRLFIISPVRVEEYLIKRVIGMPNDKIVINEGGLFLNDKRMFEEYLIAYPKETDFRQEQKETHLIVPEDSYFVLGDNRFNSIDSREFGVISKEDVMGKAVFFWGVEIF